MNDICNRLNALIEYLDISKKDFANSINSSAGNVTDWLKGRYKPSHKALSNIEKIYNVSPRWLIDGEGEMINTDSSISESLTVSNLSTDEVQLINLYRSLSDLDKGQTLGFIKGLKVDHTSRQKDQSSSNSQTLEEEAITIETA